MEKRALGFDTSQLATLERVNVEYEGYLRNIIKYVYEEEQNKKSWRIVEDHNPH